MHLVLFALMPLDRKNMEKLSKRILSNLGFMMFCLPPHPPQKATFSHSSLRPEKLIYVDLRKVFLITPVSFRS